MSDLQNYIGALHFAGIKYREVVTDKDKPRCRSVVIDMQDGGEMHHEFCAGRLERVWYEDQLACIISPA